VDQDVDGSTDRARTCIVTGAASGIGRAVAEQERRSGSRVISIDLRDADVEADLADASSRARVVDEVQRLADGAPVDALVACAGIAAPVAATVHVNYFGVVDVLEGLRPLLVDAAAPRAVLVSSVAAVHPTTAGVVDACLDGDEQRAHEEAEAAVDRGEGHLLYASSKAAVSRWVRRVAATPAWAGSGIALNAVAPGIVATDLIRSQLEDPAARAQLEEWVPMPLGGAATADQLAEVITVLTGPAAALLAGQVLYVDGGAEATLRGDRVW